MTVSNQIGEVIYPILCKYYGGLYTDSLCAAMAEWIVSKTHSGQYKTTGDLFNYIWMNTSGGGVAEKSSKEIQSALPNIYKDTFERTYVKL